MYIHCSPLKYPSKSTMPSTSRNPRIQVDPLDIEGKSEEERVQLALEAVRRNGFRPNGRPWLSLREAASAFNVGKTKLTARFNGRKTKIDAHQHEKALTFAQESALVDWVKEMGRRGVPLHLSAVAQHASAISGTMIGERWASRFRARHPELKSKWTTGLEKCRAQSLNAAAVSGFYDILEDVITTYNIPVENQYNMDEKGVQLGLGKRVRVMVDRDQKSVYQVEDGNRELVTMIECVCADGTAIRPSAVFKGAKRNAEWGRDNPANARFVFDTNPISRCLMSV